VVVMKNFEFEGSYNEGNEKNISLFTLAVGSKGDLYSKDRGKVRKDSEAIDDTVNTIVNMFGGTVVKENRMIQQSISDLM